MTYQFNNPPTDEKLLLLEDLDNGYKYYMHKLDLFVLREREYVVFAPFEPDDGEHNEPELIIMRVIRQAINNQQQNSKAMPNALEIQFESIRDQNELDQAFAVFNERMVAGILGIN